MLKSGVKKSSLICLAYYRLPQNCRKSKFRCNFRNLFLFFAPYQIRKYLYFGFKSFGYLNFELERYSIASYYTIGIICVNILLNWPHIKEDKQNKVHGKAENVSYGRLNVELFIVHAAALSSSFALFCFISRIIESPNDLQ